MFLIQTNWILNRLFHFLLSIISGRYLIKMGAKKSKTSLDSEELNYLMKHTNLDGATVKQWYSGFLRDCPNGKMTQDQFFSMYRMLIPEGNTEKFCEHVFRTFDADNNGYIDFLEFLFDSHNVQAIIRQKAPSRLSRL